VELAALQHSKQTTLQPFSNGKLSVYILDRCAKIVNFDFLINCDFQLYDPQVMFSFFLLEMIVVGIISGTNMCVMMNVGYLYNSVNVLVFAFILLSFN